MNIPKVILYPHSSKNKGRIKFKTKSQRRERFIPETGKSIQETKRFVLEQQQILAVAIRKQDVNLANKLIRKMIRSKDSRILAVYKTISTKGYRSTGYLDKKPITNADYKKLVADLWKAIKRPTNYRSKPLKRTLIPKPKGGLRPISVPSYFDRSLQHLYKLVLEVCAEEVLSPYSFGFRPFRSPGWATKCLILATFPRVNCPNFALELDIAKCFDTMDHDWMIKNICNITLDASLPDLNVIPRHILSQWLKCGYVLVTELDKGIYNPLPTTGIPQGGPISPTIANLVLHGVEDKILEIAKAIHAKIYPARFADDITVLFDEPSLYTLLLNEVDKFFEPRGMKLNREKCFLRNLAKKEPFNFVGFSHHVVKKRRPKHDIKRRTRAKNFTLVNLPLQPKLLALKKKIDKKLKDYKRPAEAVFKELNLILNGWLNFYCCANSARTFKSLSWWLWHKIFKFFWNKYKVLKEFRFRSSVKRKLLGNYIIKKHTRRHGKSLVDHVTPRRFQWWYVPLEETTNKKLDLFLTCPELTPIIQPAIIYFRPGTRLGLSAFHPLDRIELQKKALGWKFGLWTKALIKTKGCCAKCNCTLISLTEDDIFELHHVKPLQFGGPRTLPNMLPLCKECHLEVSISVSSKDIPKIIEYESMGILKEVSNALLLLEDKKPQENSSLTIPLTP